MKSSRPAAVTEVERAAFERQAIALARFESDDDGTPESRARRIDEADRDRATHGSPPLKTEPELHRRARDLGLIRR
jgi:hypothetical protein